MPNTMQAPVAAAKDLTAKPLIAKFFTGPGYQRATAMRYVTDIVLCAGQPSYAIITSPMPDFGPGAYHSQAPAVAMQTTGPAGEIKLLARVSAGYAEGKNYQVLLNGWVGYHTHFLGEDSLATTFFDDRAIMDKYTCFGRMTYNPQSKRHYFNTNNNDALVFNQYGWGNIIDSKWGPRITEGHRFGHTSGVNSDPSDEPDIGSATTMTRKATCSDIIDYLWAMFAAEGQAYRPKNISADYGLMTLPSSIKWPRGLGAALGENRTPRDFSLEGMSLLAALQKVVRYAGPYDIYLHPISDTQSELKIINYAPKPGAGTTVYGQGYGVSSLAEAMSNAQYAVDGWIKENAMGYFENVVNMGDSPAIEVMASTDPADDEEAFGGLLQFAWESTTEEALRLDIEANGNDPDAYNLAIKKRPDVYNYYKIALNKNPFAGTKWDGLLTNDGPLRLKTHQLTSYNSSISSPLGMIPMDIIVEFKLTQVEYDALSEEDKEKGYWRFATRYTDLQLSPCGRFIQLPAVRDAGPASAGTWYQTDGSEGTYDGSHMRARHMRIQLVIEAEQCLVSRAGKGTADPYGTLSRLDPNAPKFSFQNRNAPMQYVDWLRHGKSNPYGRGGLTAAQVLSVEAKASRGNELFTDHIGDGDLTNPKNRLDRHSDIILKNVKRVAYEGIFNIARMTPIYHPGMPIRYENGGGLPAFGVCKCVVISREGQKFANGTQVEWGPNEWSAIWDGPMKVFQSPGGGVSGAVKTEKPETPTSDEGTPTSGGGGKTPTSSDTSGGGGGIQTSGGAGNTQGTTSGMEDVVTETDDGTGTGKTVKEVTTREVSGQAETSQTMSDETATATPTAAPAAAAAPNRQSAISGPASKGDARKEKQDRKAAVKAEKTKARAEAKKFQRSNQGSVDTQEMDAANAAYDVTVAKKAAGSAVKGDGGPLKGAAYDAQRAAERGVGPDKHVTGQGREAFEKSARAAKAKDSAAYDAQRQKERGVGPDQHVTGKGRAAFEKSVKRPAGSRAGVGTVARAAAAQKQAAGGGGPRGPSRIRNEEDMKHDGFFAKDGKPSAGILAGDALKARDEERRFSPDGAYSHLKGVSGVKVTDDGALRSQGTASGYTLPGARRAPAAGMPASANRVLGTGKTQADYYSIYKDLPSTPAGGGAGVLNPTPKPRKAPSKVDLSSEGDTGGYARG